jgi:uncharacterized membrane protein
MPVGGDRTVTQTPAPSRPAPAAADAPPDADDVEEPESGGAGAWFLLALGVIGLGVSAYLTTLHYAGVAAICPGAGGVVNCQAVLSSTYSSVPGTSVPVTVPGMLWFIVSGSLAAASLLAARRGVAEPTWLRPVHLGWTVVGLLAVLYFVFCEVVELHEICVWCTSVHVMVFLSLLVAVARLQVGRVPTADETE